MSRHIKPCLTAFWLLTATLWLCSPLPVLRADSSPPAVDVETERIRRLATGPAVPAPEAAPPAPAPGTQDAAISPGAPTATGESAAAAGTGGQSGFGAREGAVHPNERMPLGAPHRSQSTAEQSAESGEAGQIQWIVTTASALAAVLGLIFLIRAGLVRFGGHVPSSGQSPVLEVMSRVAVAPKSNILIIRISQRVLVVGESPAGLRTLAEITDPEEVAATLQAAAIGKTGSATRSFTQVMNGMDRQYDTQPDSRLEGADTGEVHADRARHRVSALTARLRAFGARGGDG